MQTTTLTALRRQKASAWVSAGGVLFNILGNPWAIPRWGAHGSAAMLVSTQIVVFLLGLFCLREAKTVKMGA